MEIEPKAEGGDYVEEEPDSEPERERDAEEVEEIFIKEAPAKPVRKKRELTDAQREGLRKGREKMKARRLAKMKEEITEEVVMKSQAPPSVKRKVIKDKQISAMRKRLEDRESATRKVKRDRYDALKYKVLESMTSVKEFDNLSNLLEEITEDDIYDDEILRTKINDLFKRVNGKGLR
tara:strand:+ start:5039 stop:5572 length:534 start_codon:yes stop_codon:yes gene_type:complete